MGTAAIGGGYPSRVAVLRALQLGDLLCAVPALRAIRAALPSSEIVLVGLPWATAFVERFHDCLDGFLEFPGYPGLAERTPDLQSIPRFLADAQARRFDLVIQMHGSGEITNPIAVLLGGRTTAGFYRRGGFCPHPDRFLVYPDDEPETRRLLGLVAFLGIPLRGEYLEFPIDDADRAEAAAVVGSQLRGERYACIHPGARAAERRWPAAAFARVADEIARQGFGVVLTGSADEGALTGQVRRSMREPAMDLSGRTSLGGLAAVLAGARLVVTNDTGVSHIADALGVPSVVVFAASDPRRWAPLDRAKHRVVDARLSTPDPGLRGSTGSPRPELVEGRTPDDERRAIERAIVEAADLLRTEGLYAA